MTINLWDNISVAAFFSKFIVIYALSRFFNVYHSIDKLFISFLVKLEALYDKNVKINVFICLITV